MPRPRKPRTIGFMPDNRGFYPERKSEQWVELSFVELEAIRLADGIGLDQDESAEAMNISRGTFQRIIGAARRKIADAMIHGKNIKIEGGDYAYREMGRGHGRGMGMGRRYRGGRG